MNLIILPDNYILNKYRKTFLQNSKTNIFINRNLNIPNKIIFKKNNSHIKQNETYKSVNEYNENSLITLDQLKNHIKLSIVWNSNLISDFLSFLIIENIINSMQKKSELKYFKKICRFNGFIKSIKDFIFTLKRAGVTPQIFKKIIIPGNLKFSELALIYHNYSVFLSANNISDESDTDFQIINQVKNNFNKIDIFKNIDNIIIKHIYDFEINNFCLFNEISKKINLTIEFPLPDRQTAETYSFIDRNISKFENLGDSNSNITLEFENSEYSGIIQYFADTLFDNKKKNDFEFDKSKLLDSISVCKCNNSAAEIDYIANQISILLKQNVSPENIAVYTSSPESYIKHISFIFKKYKIPFKHKSIILLKDISIIKFLLFIYKTAAGPLLKSKISTIFNSSYSKNFYHSIDAKTLFLTEFKDFTENFNLTEINNNILSNLLKTDSVKLKYKSLCILEQLVSQFDSLNSNNTLDKHIEGFSKLLYFFGLPLKISKNSEIDESVFRDSAGLKNLIEIINETKLSCRKLNLNDSMDLSEFYEFLCEICSNNTVKQFDLNISSIPILDLSKSAYRQFDYVFMAGLNSRFIPSKLYFDPLISDSEKNILNKKFFESHVKNEYLKKGLVLFETIKNKIIEDKYTFYAASRTARKKIFYTFSSTDETGNQDNPSIYINEIISKLSSEKKYNYLRHPHITDWKIQDINNIDDLLLKMYYSAFKTINESDGFDFNKRDIFKKIRMLPHFKKIMRIVAIENKRTSFFSESVINKYDASNHFSGKLNSDLSAYDKKNFSVTKLELFAICPFKFYCSEILKLSVKETPEDSIESSKIGETIHDIIAEYFKNFTKNELPELNLLLKIGDKKLDLLLNSYKTLDSNLKKIIKQNYLKILTKFYECESIIFAKKKYCKIISEHKFENIEIGNIIFKGKIDRIDFFEDGSIRLFDYKLSKKERINSFKNKNSYGITHLQLPVYFIAAQKEFNKFNLSEDSGFYLINRYPITLKAEILNSELLEKKLIELNSLIKTNNFSIRPENCDYCDFKTVCRINFYK